MSRSRAMSGLAAVSLSVVAACSDGPSVNPSPALSGGDAGPSSEGGGPDAASITPRPELCSGVVPGGPIVQEMDLPGDAPAPVGGPVAQGTYDLIELDVYRGAAPLDAGTVDSGGEPPTTQRTGKTAQKTIVVGEFTMSFVGVRGTARPPTSGPREERGVRYRVDGTSLVQTQVCPMTKLPAPAPFSAITGSLVLFPDATHRELYLRRQ